MENLEDDMAEIARGTPDLEVEAGAIENPSPIHSNENLDDSVASYDSIDRLIFQIPPIDGSLLKTKLEETFNDGPADSLPSGSLDQNPCSSSAAAAAAAAATTSSTSNVLECPICLQTCIHPARLPCGHIFCFLCVKGVAYKNRRCAMCRREIPPEFLDHPQLVNGIEDICTTKATDDGYQWFYEGRNGWWQYDDRTSQDLEEAFKKGERSCTILVAGYVYIVDFDAMIQQRQNEPARCRRVKRDLATIPKKGVAGLRIEGNTVTTDSNFAAQVYQSRQNRYRNGDLLYDGDLDNPDNSILHANAAVDPPSPNTQGRLRVSYGGLGGYVIELGNPSEFVSTAAATDAALRIASDIIGSTLAHADELTRSGGSNTSPSSSASAYNHHLNTINSPDTSLRTSTAAVISRVTPPNAGLAFSADKVQLKIGEKTFGVGSVYISENSLVWQPTTNLDGIYIFWKQISVHGISTIPSKCIYFMLDQQFIWPSTYECKVDQSNGDGGSGSDKELAETFDDEEQAEITECWLIPEDQNSVSTMYHAMTECQALHPDSGDSISEDSEYMDDDDDCSDGNENEVVEEVRGKINNMSLNNDSFTDAGE